MSRAQISVLSSYDEVDEDPTPRVQQNTTPRVQQYQEGYGDVTPKSTTLTSDRPMSYLEQYQSEKTKQEMETIEAHHENAIVGAGQTTHQSHAIITLPYEASTNQTREAESRFTNISKPPLTAKVSPTTAAEKQSPSSSKKVVGTVAPKPQPPTKNFIEKNKDKARGICSAKSSYSSRLMQAKKEQENIKDWAPGMVVPRKKAASADNAVRSHKASDNSQEETVLSPPPNVKHAFSTEDVPQMTAQSIWEHKSARLAEAKSKKSTRLSKRQIKQPQQRPDMENESQIKVEMDLSSNQNFVPIQQGMKLIGPIPPQNVQAFAHVSPRNYRMPVVGTIQGPLLPAGPVQGYPSHIGPAQPYAVITGPAYTPNIPTGPVYQPHHHHNHQVVQGYSPYNINTLDPPTLNSSHTVQQWSDDNTSMIPNSTANDSYYQYYQQSKQQSADYSHNSRWNTQKVRANSTFMFSLRAR